MSTVSRVLNGSEDDARGAPPGTVERIRALAAELRYQANPHAASLKTRRSRSIGVLVPRLSDMVLATIYEGVDEAAAEHGYLTFVSNTQDQPDKQRKLIDMAVARRVDGLILGDAHTARTPAQSAAGGAGRARRALRAGQPPCRRALRGNLTTSRAAASLRAICWTWAIAASR